jgi:hypothetical protein
MYRKLVALGISTDSIFTIDITTGEVQQIYADTGASPDGLQIADGVAYWTTMGRPTYDPKQTGEAALDYSARNGGVHPINIDGTDRRDLTAPGDVWPPQANEVGSRKSSPRACALVQECSPPATWRTARRRSTIRSGVTSSRLAADRSASSSRWVAVTPPIPKESAPGPVPVADYATIGGRCVQVITIGSADWAMPEHDTGALTQAAPPVVSGCRKGDVTPIPGISGNTERHIPQN